MAATRIRPTATASPTTGKHYTTEYHKLHAHSLLYLGLGQKAGIDISMRIAHHYLLYSKIKQLEKLTEKEQGKIVFSVAVSAVCPQHTHTGTIDAFTT